jgi:signal transduction histidine kinase
VKSTLRIFTRYVASAVGIAIILLILNLLVLLGSMIGWMIQSKNTSPQHYSIQEFSENLVFENGEFSIPESSMQKFQNVYQWAMLLDESGKIIWSESLPDDVPHEYSLSDVASFTRWYLNDYPVRVWQHPNGLLVLGSAKHSTWKYGVEFSESTLNKMPVWITIGFILNGVAALLLALLFGLGLFHSIRTMAIGIESLSKNKPVALSENGLLGELAIKINQTSRQLAKQEKVLQKRDNARSTWIAGISHDIRTPLSLVMGYASQLESNPNIPKAEQEQAGIIRQQSESIKDLINNLNLASKLEYDMQPLEQKTFYPSELIREVVTDIINSKIGEYHSIELTVEKDIEKLKLVGDIDLLRRAFSNVILNSIQHNADGCDISVEIKKESATCCVIISDNGVGFSQEMLETLVSQHDNISNSQSHGLGLVIVKQIIQAHYGTVEFAANSPRGCTLTLKLPILQLH